MTNEMLGERLALINACLNGTSALLIFIGWRFAKSHRANAHRACMLGALTSSALFLGSYLTRVAITGTHTYPHDGWMRVLYLTILFSHMILAVAVVPLVFRSVWLGLHKRVDEHRKIARITLPIWLYVSVTGVVVYVMLYSV